MKTEKIAISKIKLNPNNPRLIKDDKFAKLVKSITEFPEMLEIRPIVVNDDMIILGGNMRFKACKEAGLKEVSIIKVSGLSAEKQREFLIKDNVSGGEWDWKLLNDWDALELESWGLDLPADFVTELEAKEEDKEIESHEKLKDVFLIEPYSVLDSRNGEWQKRKEYWKNIIKDKGDCRTEEDFNIRRNTGIVKRNNEIATEKQKLYQYGENNISILDPVLSELILKWFSIEKCKTFDCFAGDTVFGYISSYLGNLFTGIELRQEQVNFNNEKTKILNAKYICDDGRNILNHIDENSQDLLFSCPPYFDLEVYSELLNDASNQKDYKDFINILDTAFTNSIKCLKNNRFAVIVCGSVREKNNITYGGFYPFQQDIINIFKKNGLHFYNDIILIDNNGTAHLRARPYMNTRKVVTIHQNVLVFFKGDPKKIKEIYPKIEIKQNESTDV